MSTIVFIVDAIPSHIYSSLGVARRLHRRGFAVEYWGVARNGSDALVNEHDFPFRIIPGMWSRYQEDIRLPTDLSLFNAAFRVAKIARMIDVRRKRWRLIREELDSVEAWLDAHLPRVAPSFVVLDPFLLAYYPLLHRRCMPTVVLSTKPLPIQDPGVPPYDSWLIPARTWWSPTVVRLAWLRPKACELRYRLIQRACRFAKIYTYHDILREATRRTGFPARDELMRRFIQPDLHFKSLHEWALWTPEIDFPRHRPLPTNVRHIGTSVDTARTQSSTPVLPLTGTEVLIYVAVGTVRFRWRDNLTFLRKVIRAFAEMPHIVVVISTGDPRATAALGELPHNVLIYDFVPQLRMLDIADLVITHAGAGTYRECIEKEVPMLAYPRNHDQVGNAARVAYHGIGLRGHRRWDSVASIRRKALTILEDGKFRQNLRHLHNAVQQSQDRLLTDALEALSRVSMVDVTPQAAAQTDTVARAVASFRGNR